MNTAATTQKIVATAAARGLHAEVPANMRVGRVAAGHGVAYRNFIPAAHMPFPTSTRQLRAGFAFLTDAEAAEIALAYLPTEVARAQAEHTRETEYQARRAERGEDSSMRWADARLEQSLAKAAKMEARYRKVVASAAAPAPEAEQAPEHTGTCQVCKARPSTGWTGATDASEACERCDDCAASTSGAFTAWPKGKAPATAAVAARHAGSTSAELELSSAAAAKVLADRRWRQSVSDAAAAGLSHRAIATLAGISHPTVAKILAEEGR